MNAAFVTNCLDDFTYEQVRKLAVGHTVCVFLPEAYNGPISEKLLVRRYAGVSKLGRFQRYDIVIFYAKDEWDEILSIMREVMGVAVIDGDSQAFERVSETTEYLVGTGCDLNSYVSSLPKHIHWNARNEREILGRVEEFGLLTSEFQRKYEQVFCTKIKKRKGNRI